jgi:3-oxoacyl-[acyl-carrier protein] reductase
MADAFVSLAANPQVQLALRTLGVKLPLPPVLPRQSGAWAQPLLADLPVLVIGATGDAAMARSVVDQLRRQGAPVVTPAGVGHVEASGAALAVDDQRNQVRIHGLVLDATGLRQAADLEALYRHLHPWLGRLRAGGSVVLLARPVAVDGEDAELAAVQQGIEGAVRSLGKEIGRRGGRANLVRVAPGGEGSAGSTVAWLLSRRSAFVTTQVIGVRAGSTQEGGWRLDGQTALVTGAAQGIGAATAALLAAQGARVILHDRPVEAERLEAMAERLGGAALTADLMDDGAADTIARGVRALGGVDVVVHNAGITRDRTLARMKPEQWQSVLRVNLEVILALHEALVAEGLRDGGRVIGLSSIAGIAGNMGQTAYAASKAAVAGWVRSEAEHLRARGITVNAVAPGFIETRMTAAVPPLIREFGRRRGARSQGGMPEDVADAIAWLASPAAAGVRGQVVRVCGGGFLGA